MKINTDALFKAASAKLGMPEDKLREAISSGNISALKQYMSDSDKAQLDKALNNKKLADDLKSKLGQ